MQRFLFPANFRPKSVTLRMDLIPELGTLSMTSQHDSEKTCDHQSSNMLYIKTLMITLLRLFLTCKFIS